MAVRSTTARRLATVIVATAAVSALGSGAASAAASPAPAAPAAAPAAARAAAPAAVPAAPAAPQVTVPPVSLPQVNALLHNLLGTVDGLLGDSLGVRTPEEIAADKDKPVLGKTVDNLTKTTKELPLLGGVAGGLTDTLGLSEPTQTAQAPTTPRPAKPTVPVEKPGQVDRGVDAIAPVGSTWTMPMEQAPIASPVVPNVVEKPSPGGLAGLASDIRNIFPTNAAEAAAAGAGAATVALIVLGGIAVTGAAGAASAAGRRGLINGSVGGSL